jgi:protein TonB
VSVLTLYEAPNRRDTRRWLIASIVIVALHAGLFAAIAFWGKDHAPAGAMTAPILIDLAPMSASPEKQELDVAPGPAMQQADPPAEIPEQQKPVEETIAPTSPQPNPVIAIPPEQTVKPPPEPATPVVPKPSRELAKKPSIKPPAPKTTAPPKAERQAALQNAAAAGAATAAATASYRTMLAAHLQRFKQYPAASQSAGERGTAILSFTVSRNGQVLGSRITRSSGYPALDADTLALLRRAQPLPAFPPEVKQASMSFNVPMAYLR